MKIRVCLLSLFVFGLSLFSISCSGGGGVVQDGLHVPPPLCGDGAINQTSEACDDGNLADGDGCSSICSQESPAEENPNPIPTSLCGNGVITDNEACDDHNTSAGDGCSATCTLEPGFSCAANPSACTTICGDGIIAGAESCDDENTDSTDGCSSACAIETGYLCSGTPSTCVQSGSEMWRRQFGEIAAANSQKVYSVATDAKDNVIVTGSFQGSVDFGDGLPLVSANGNGTNDNEDIFLAKYGPTGNLIWANKYGDSQSQFGKSVTVDDQGNIYLMGNFRGEIQIGTKLITAQGNDIFIMKLDENGKTTWLKQFQVPASGYTSKIVVDKNGNVITTGFILGTIINFGGGIQSAAGIYNGFAAKLDGSGNLVWGKVYGLSGISYMLAGDIDPADNSIFLTGEFKGNTDLGNGPLNSSNGGQNTDAFILKLDANGDYQWSKTFGNSSSGNKVEGIDIAIDSTQKIILTGNLKGATNFGKGPLTSAESSDDVFVAQFDTNGNALWSKNFGDALEQTASSLVTTSSGDILLTGNFAGSIDFGNGPLASVGATDLFVTKLNNSGSSLWSTSAGGSADQYARDIAIDSGNHPILVGEFDGVLNFGGEDLTALGTDGFLVKLNP